MMKKNKVVAVSGGFDPVHIGHVRMFEEAKKLGDKLVVILNNDNWLRKYKREEPFMPESERKEILEAFRAVDEVIYTDHKANGDDSDCPRNIASSLRKLHPDIFANGGDRAPDLDDVPTEEYLVCKELGIEMVWGIGRGGKVQSSSWLIDKKTKK